MLRQARERAGVTQEKIARKLRTKKSAISRIENHAEDIRLSTLEKYAKALGMRLKVQLTD
jgi:transcriptional regulator with XRE-family HTH domain